jgi:hypothetical protein
MHHPYTRTEVVDLAKPGIQAVLQRLLKRPYVLRSSPPFAIPGTMRDRGLASDDPAVLRVGPIFAFGT